MKGLLTIVILTVFIALFATLTNAKPYNHLIVAIKQQNVEQAERLFWDISNPEHESYGKYLSVSDLANIMGSSKHTIKSVSKWLYQSLGATSVSLLKSRDFIIAKDVAAVSRFFKENKGANYHDINQALHKQIPAELKHHIDFISVINNDLLLQNALKMPFISTPKSSNKLITLNTVSVNKEIAAAKPTTADIENVDFITAIIDNNNKGNTNSLKLSGIYIKSNAIPIVAVNVALAVKSTTNQFSKLFEATTTTTCSPNINIVNNHFIVTKHLNHSLSHFENVANLQYCVFHIENVNSKINQQQLITSTNGHVYLFANIIDDAHDSNVHFEQWNKMQAINEEAIPIYNVVFKNNNNNNQNTILIGKSWGPNNQKEIYDLAIDKIGSNSSTTQAVWGTGTYGYSVKDLQDFYSREKVFGANSNKVHAIGYKGKAGGANWGEAELDIQYISAIAPNVTSYVANTDNSSSSESGGGFGPAFVAFSTALANSDNPPHVLSLSLGSLSWGSCNLMCQQVNQMGVATLAECTKFVQNSFQVCMYDTQEQVIRINTELMKVGMRGVSVLAATGDGGNHFSFGAFSPLTAIGRALNKVACQYTLPTFPAASPYVTGVGATQMVDRNNKEIPIGCAANTGGQITSGAAFAIDFPMPDYQKQAVSNYLAKLKPTFSGFNASNRAYPDVSAIGSNVPIVQGGRTIPVGGTSASTPEFAGIVSLLNDALLDRGLPVLGFLNQRIYNIGMNPSKYAASFIDVTEGNTRCGIDLCCSTGFSALEGWDAMTGFGSPLFAGLYKELLNR